MNQVGKSSAMIVFAISLLFFNWPLVSIADDSYGIVLVIYLFILWLLAIAGLRAYCSTLIKSQKQSERGDEHE